MKTEERRRDATQRDEDKAAETSYLYVAVNTEHDGNGKVYNAEQRINYIIRHQVIINT